MGRERRGAERRRENTEEERTHIANIRNKTRHIIRFCAYKER